MNAKKVDDFLTKHNRIMLAGIVVMALTVRLIYFFEFYDSPPINFHHATASDMHFFVEWARQIEHGDYLTNQTLHPYNQWQESLAAKYFKLNPKGKAFFKTINAENPGKAAWDKWYGEKRFHQAPFYPYFLAVVFKLFSNSIYAVFIFQMMMGVFTTLLIYLITLRYFGRCAACIAGGICVLCPLLFLYELVLLRATFIVFFNIALLYFSQLSLDRNSKKIWLFTGVLFGLSILVKPIFILFFIIVAVSCLVKNWSVISVMLPNATFLIGGMLITLSPAIARNVSVGVSPMALTSVGPITFACTNTKNYTPDMSIAFPCSVREVPKILVQSEGRFTDTVIATIKSHGSLSSFFKLLFKKFFGVWLWYEKPLNINVNYFKLYSKILRYLPITFAMISGLAFLGIAIASLQFKQLPLLYFLCAVTVLPMILFYNTTRFRVPLLAALIPFASFGLLQAMQYLKTKPILITLFLILTFIAPFFIIRKPYIRHIDHFIAYKHYYYPRASQADQIGDMQKVKHLHAKFFKNEPDFNIVDLKLNKDLRDSAQLFVEARQYYARLLRESGEIDAANLQQKYADKIKKLIHISNRIVSL